MTPTWTGPWRSRCSRRKPSRGPAARPVIDSAGGTGFIAIEFVAGKTLEHLISRKGLGLGETLKYSIQVADALAKAHSAGIVHRDLKPANIMVTDDGHVKVLDFGLAKLAESSSDDDATETLDHSPRTEEGTILGTVSYMSPIRTHPPSWLPGFSAAPREAILLAQQHLPEVLLLIDEEKGRRGGGTTPNSHHWRLGCVERCSHPRVDRTVNGSPAPGRNEFPRLTSALGGHYWSEMCEASPAIPPRKRRISESLAALTCWSAGHDNWPGLSP